MKNILISAVLACTLIGAKRYPQQCEPCKALPRGCDWSGGIQRWYQTPYNGSIGSAQSSFLSEVGYPNPDAARVII